MGTYYTNEIKIKGRVGKDADLSYLPSGKAICKWSLAVSQGKDKDTDWFNCVAFGDKAEQWAGQIQKGMTLEVNGKMTSNKGTDGKVYWQVIAWEIKGQEESKPDVPEGWEDIVS